MNFQTDPAAVTRYYQAANLYLHPAKADTFPLTILEALACGTPVIGTAVGGIPEQIKGLKITGSRFQASDFNQYTSDEATGVMVRPAAAHEMAQDIVYLLSHPELNRQLAVNATADARQRFDLQRQTKEYLNWYNDMTHIKPGNSQP